MDPLIGHHLLINLQHSVLTTSINPLASPDASTYSTAAVVIFAVIAALGGGALGASFGALPAFVMTGFLVIAGAVAASLGLDGAQATIYAAAWGPMFGPHVGFQGGAAAAAYTKKYHPDLLDDAKNILVPLGAHKDILAVGAIFGAVGQLLKMGTDYVTGTSGQLGFAHIAWIIVFLAFVHRALFGYDIIGRPSKEQLADASQGASWLSFRHNDTAAHAPYQFYWGEGIMLGALVGAISGYVALMTGSPWLTFGISAASLVFLETPFGTRDDVERAGFPITHQITLPSAVGALAAFGMSNPPIDALWWALIVAIVFGALGEVFRLLGDRLFYAWGDTHLDPPAVSIVLSVALLVICSAAGIIGDNAFLGIGLHWF